MQQGKRRSLPLQRPIIDMDNKSQYLLVKKYRLSTNYIGSHILDTECELNLRDKEPDSGAVTVGVGVGGGAVKASTVNKIHSETVC